MLRIVLVFLVLNNPG